MDVRGPMQVVSRGGKRYVATYIDDYSKFSVLRPIAQESNVFEVTREVLTMLENVTECKTKIIRSDKGCDYIRVAIEAWFKKKGIQHHKTAPHTPEQNGVAELHNHIFVGRTLEILREAGLPLVL
jgi:transposase InsO family protein